ncbi:MAG: EamA family transporter [Chloroflexi bacterium]|nr:EamA family transporter [Chloroflexota bacterium]
MHYLALVLMAMVGYGVFSILAKIALRNIPPEAAVIVTNGLLLISAVAWSIYRQVSVTSHISLNTPTLLLLLAGAVLSFSIISFYLALSRGPASVVVPIFSMSFAVASVLGILILGEPLKMVRILGVLMAIGAIALLTR